MATTTTTTTTERRTAATRRSSMPMYMGHPVSDAYLQGLVESYRDGQRAGGHPVEDGDQVIIDRLSEYKVLTRHAPSAFDLGESGETGPPTPEVLGDSFPE
jgi:hypothetical protein